MKIKSINFMSMLAFLLLCSYSTNRAFATGELAPWIIIGDLPEHVSGRLMIAVGDYWYAMEGDYADQGYLGTLYSKYQPDGSMGIWSYTSPRNIDRFNYRLVSYNNYIYLIGGELSPGGFNMIPTVEYAHINSDGTLSSWQTTTSLSIPRYVPAVAAYNGYLYVVGGCANAAGITSTEYAQIMPDGSLGQWKTGSPTLTPHPYAVGMAKDGFLYVFGGTNNSFGTTAVERAQTNPDGSIGSWQYDTPLPENRGDPGIVVLDNKVYLIGGNPPLGGSAYSSVIWSDIFPDHTLSAWQYTQPLNYARWHCCGSLWNGHIYATGDYSVEMTKLFEQTEPPCEPEMVLIPGGEFQMGDSKGDEVNPDELPVHTVTLNSFYIGKFEVTNGQYCQYLNSALGQGLITEPTGGVVYKAGSGTDYPYCDTNIFYVGSQIEYSEGFFNVRIKGGRDMSNDPMLFVSWYGAVAYCNWLSHQEGKEQCYNLLTWECDFSKDGYRLPTEAEWEYAARGGLVGKRFSWGDTIDRNWANYWGTNYYAYDLCPPPWGYDPTWDDGIWPYTSPGGSFAANGYGLYDMVGNVWEWCHDWYSDTYYTSSPASNPTGPPSGTNRVLRGGSWGDQAIWCRVAYRDSYSPIIRRDHWCGFRVAGSAEPPIANAGENIQIASAEQSYTVIQGTATDPDGDPLEYRWLEDSNVIADWNDVGPAGEAYLNLGTLPLFDIGNHTLTLEVREIGPCGLTASDDMVLTIQNSPPEVQAAPTYQVVEIGIDPIIVVGDVGDFDGDTLSYQWLTDSDEVLASGSIATTQGGATVPVPELHILAGDSRFPVGVHGIHLQVSDGVNAAVRSSVSVKVTDTTAPSLSPVPSMTILWPPNHKLVPVTIWANAFDNGGGEIVLSVTVQSSEPADGQGDGNTECDYYIDSVDDETGVIELRLRAERSGKGDGRTYTVTITATDESLNQSVAVVEIFAPHDKRKK